MLLSEIGGIGFVKRVEKLFSCKIRTTVKIIGLCVLFLK